MNGPERVKTINLRPLIQRQILGSWHLSTWPASASSLRAETIPRGSSKVTNLVANKDAQSNRVEEMK